MKVLYFGFYNPDYSRNKILTAGLRLQGVEVIECHVKQRGLRSFFDLLMAYWRAPKDYDLMVVGFPGQEAMLLARFLTRKPIVFDAFTSHYGGYILDRQYASKNSFRAWRYWLLDRWSCRLANHILLDTQAHIQFFVSEFGLPKEKFSRVWAGADESVFQPLPQEDTLQFRVLFFGTFIPLQGVQYIIEAANILRNSSVQFHIIGDGQQKDEMVAYAEQMQLQNIFFQGFLKPQELRYEIAKADVCLGIFGSTPKTALVIPNKVYIAVAMHRSVVTSDTPAIRELFTSEELMLIPQGDPHAIAKAIVQLQGDAQRRASQVHMAAERFRVHIRTEVLGREFANICHSLVKR